VAIYGNHSPWVSAMVDEDQTSRPYLFIVWSDKSSSIYDVEWLERFQYDDKSRMERRKRSEVQPSHAVRKNGPPLWHSTAAAKEEYNLIYPEGNAPQHGADGLVHIDYSSVIGEDGQQRCDGLFNLLHFIFRDGAVIVSNTPSPFLDHNNYDAAMVEDALMPVAKLAKAMSGGALSHGMLYGDIFHVRTGERNANNLAYTSSALCPHQDMAYYESTPGMQLLHCVAMGKDIVGGESTLIDAMAAAYRLRELRPESFQTLTNCPATFVKQRNEACMTYRRPHISLAKGRCSIFDREITAVHWSPPFEGPLCLPPEDVEEYYHAYADFEQLVTVDLDVTCGKDLASYADEFTWKRKLNPGEVLVFNNRRMLHGRNGFTVANSAMTPADGRRHLVGCYTNIDDTLNTYRVRLRKRHPDMSASFLNVGNGSTIVP
jgi:alpha-ketoglutarate-dependent taurine dioxygenase